MKIFLRLIKWFFWLGLAGFVVGISALGVAYWKIAPDLPEVETLKEVKFQIPLRVYTSDKRLIAEFGEKRRIPLKYEQIPQNMVNAFVAAEDQNFFSHGGVDYKGLARAVVQLILTGEKRSGGSTITMQVAKNFFLTPEKTYKRKLTEIFLAYKIEGELSKQEILALYSNKIYMGQRSYGIGAAAQTYYGKDIEKLNLAQFAMLAGIPKAPSANNPVSNPERAKERRFYVLSRMLDLGFIDQAQFDEASKSLVTAKLHQRTLDHQSPYLAEMVRSALVEEHGSAAYTDGFSVYTTVNFERQQAAELALQRGVMAYERRHGYSGAIAWYDVSDEEKLKIALEALKNASSIGHLKPALVVALDEKTNTSTLRTRENDEITLTIDDVAWARKRLSLDSLGPKITKVEQVLKVGDLVLVEAFDDGRWMLATKPTVEGALVSIDPSSGALNAVVGGFDFYQSKFNRVTQSRRQAGSNFKPFVYAAGLQKNLTLASVINDAPVVFEDVSLENTWRPENYSGKFYGPTRLRDAMTYSRNLVSIRLLRQIGIVFAHDYVSRFGFDMSFQPKDLSLSLGSGSVNPLELARGYAVFANEGYSVEPYFIEQIKDGQGALIYQASPKIVCPGCVVSQGDIPGLVLNGFAPRVVDEKVIYQVRSMLKDVVNRGTGRRAKRELGRNDLGGKTGTTNDQKDAWFSGFNSDVVTTAWVGKDDFSTLGARETGGKAALPIWIGFMNTMLKGKSHHDMAMPPGMVTVRINKETGERARPSDQNVMFEVFASDRLPPEPEAVAVPSGGQLAVDSEDEDDSLF